MEEDDYINEMYWDEDDLMFEWPDNQPTYEPTQEELEKMYEEYIQEEKREYMRNLEHKLHIAQLLLDAIK